MNETESNPRPALFNPRINERMHEILENIDVIASMNHMALIGRSPHLTSFRENIGVAIVASSLGLNSLDYAKRRYGEFVSNEAKLRPGQEAYISAYFCAKSYVEATIDNFQTEGIPEPTSGVYGASVVLLRLPYSFFCAHLLYLLGHEYEAHAVSRLILEQIAWAYAAHELDDLEAIAKIKATRAITKLKSYAPETGQLYGFLSAKTHLDYSNHREFLRVDEGVPKVFHTRFNYTEFAHAIVLLADLFGLVWERSQWAYLKSPQATVPSANGPVPNPKRPFLEKMHSSVDAIEEAVEKPLGSE